MKRIWIRGAVSLLAAVLVAVVLVAVVLAPSSASAGPPGNGICDAGEICLYEHSHFGGGVADFRCNVSFCTVWTFTDWHFSNGVPLNDRVSSMKNRTSNQIAVLYIHSPPDPIAPFFTLWPGQEERVLSWDWNDWFSSMEIAPR